jgi:hypothetical protein
LDGSRQRVRPLADVEARGSARQQNIEGRGSVRGQDMARPDLNPCAPRHQLTECEGEDEDHAARERGDAEPAIPAPAESQP